MTAGSHGIVNFSENFSMVAAHFSENDTNTKWFTDINKVVFSAHTNQVHKHK